MEFDDMTIDEQKEIYFFGKEMVKSMIFGMLVATIIAGLFREIGKGMAFCLILFPLRQNAGGFHMRTRKGCAFVSAMIFVIVLWLFKTVHLSIYFQFLIFVFSIGFILWLMPVDNSENRLTAEEKEIFRIRTGAILLVYLVVFLGLSITRRTDDSFVLVCCVGVEMVLLILGELQNKVYDRHLKNN